VQAGLCDDINLDGRVTARVVDRTSVDLGDRHFEDWVESLVRRLEKRKEKEENQERREGGRWFF
jgi:hypothetical protein